MLKKIVYECEFCGRTSYNVQEVEQCEIQHIASTLTTEEYYKYRTLQSNYMYQKAQLGTLNDVILKKRADNAYIALRNFEKAHNIIKSRV